MLTNFLFKMLESERIYLDELHFAQKFTFCATNVFVTFLIKSGTLWLIVDLVFDSEKVTPFRFPIGIGVRFIGFQ